MTTKKKNITTPVSSSSTPKCEKVLTRYTTSDCITISAICSKEFRHCLNGWLAERTHLLDWSPENSKIHYNNLGLLKMLGEHVLTNRGLMVVYHSTR